MHRVRPLHLAACFLLGAVPIALTATDTVDRSPTVGPIVSPMVLTPIARAARDDGPILIVPTTTTTEAATIRDVEATASASTVAPPVPDPWAETAPGWEGRRGAAALATIDYPWSALGYAIHFEPARSGFLGLTDPATRTVTVWVRPELTEADLASILAHELGHVVDLVATTADERGRYLQIRNLPSDHAWDPCANCSDYRTPAGDWAESFAEWLIGPHGWRSELGPAPSEEQLSHLAPLFAP